MKRYCFFPVAAFCCSLSAFTQLKWVNVDSLYQPLPPSVHVYKTTDSPDSKANIAYYVSAELKDKNIFLKPIQLIKEDLLLYSFIKRTISRW
jgi:hypothetical protein